MKFKFITLRSILSKDDKELDKDTSNFINEILKGSSIINSNDGKEVFLLETGGVEEEFKRIYKNYKEPFILVPTMKRNSFAASLEIKSFLDKNNLESKLLYGDINSIKCGLLDNITNEKIAPIYELKPNKILLNKRLARIGEPSGWLISSDVKASDVTRVFGATLIDIDYHELVSEIDKKEYPDNDAVKKIKDKFAHFNGLEMALCIYGALIKLINKYQLDGLSIRCFDLLDIYHNTSCLALALLNDSGIISSCEGDVPALLSMMILKELGKDSFQVNPSNLLTNNNHIIFAHCTIPTKMCKSYTLDTHFESGLGVAIKGELNLGNATIFKIDSSLTKYACFEGKIVKNLHLPCFCRTQVEMEFNVDLQGYLKNPLGNHLIISYGKSLNDINKILGNKPLK